MKIIQTIGLLMLLVSCSPQINESSIIEKYVEGYHMYQYAFAKNRKTRLAKKSFEQMSLIIEEAENGKISNDLRKSIVTEVDSMSLPKQEYYLNSYKHLKVATKDFKVSNDNFINDLIFIDLFLEYKYWQISNEGTGIRKVRMSFNTDTILLNENTSYQIPIQIIYDEGPSSETIVSNTMQGRSPHYIVFKTWDAQKKHQTIEYTCKTINYVTNQISKFSQKIVVKLIEND